jgi:hypothetical protein
MLKNTFKLGLWGTIALVFVYVAIMNLFFEYIINSDVDSILQGVSILVALAYTVWTFKQISNFINKKL